MGVAVLRPGVSARYRRVVGGGSFKTRRERMHMVEEEALIRMPWKGAGSRKRLRGRPFHSVGRRMLTMKNSVAGCAARPHSLAGRQTKRQRWSAAQAGCAGIGYCANETHSNGWTWTKTTGG